MRTIVTAFYLLALAAATIRCSSSQPLAPSSVVDVAPETAAIDAVPSELAAPEASRAPAITATAAGVTAYRGCTYAVRVPRTDIPASGGSYLIDIDSNCTWVLQAHVGYQNKYPGLAKAIIINAKGTLTSSLSGQYGQKVKIKVPALKAGEKNTYWLYVNSSRTAPWPPGCSLPRCVALTQTK